MQVEFKSSVIFVSDINKSKEFYQDFLGLQIEMDHGPCVGYTCGLSIWQKDHVENVVYKNNKSLDLPLGKSNLELYFETEDLDQFNTELETRDYQILSPLESAPWGQRTIRFADPDGHMIEVGETLTVVIKRFRGEGMNDEEVAARMHMPLQAVQYLGSL